MGTSQCWCSVRGSSQVLIHIISCSATLNIASSLSTLKMLLCCNLFWMTSQHADLVFFLFQMHFLIITLWSSWYQSSHNNYRLNWRMSFKKPFIHPAIKKSIFPFDISTEEMQIDLLFPFRRKKKSSNILENNLCTKETALVMHRCTVAYHSICREK